MYSSINVDKCVYPWNHHHKQERIFPSPQSAARATAQSAHAPQPGPHRPVFCHWFRSVFLASQKWNHTKYTLVSGFFFHLAQYFLSTYMLRNVSAVHSFLLLSISLCGCAPQWMCLGWVVSSTGLVWVKLLPVRYKSFCGYVFLFLWQIGLGFLTQMVSVCLDL